MLQSGCRLTPQPPPHRPPPLDDSGSSSTTWNATTPTMALPSAWPATAATATPNVPQVQQHVQPHEHDRVQRPSPPKNTTNRGSGCATMNCVPTMPARNPTIVFARPPMPMTPLDSASWTRPGERPGQQPGHRPGRQRDVDHRRPAPDRRPTVPRTTNRASVVCSASASAIARTTPAAFTRRSPRPLARRRRRQHDQHLLERSRSRPPARPMICL